MRTFRAFLKSSLGRTLTAVICLAALHAFAEPQNYLTALETQRAKEKQIRDIAAKLNVDPEFLLHPEGRKSFDFHSLFAWAKAQLGIAPADAGPQPPLDIREAIGRVKSRYGLVAADATLAKIANLVRLAGETPASRAKKSGQIRAEIKSLLRVIDKDFLPPVPDAAPGVAHQRDAQMRAAIHQLTQSVKQIVNAPGALDDTSLDATLAQVKNAVAGSLTIPATKRRWTRDPFPLHDTYKAAPTKQIGTSTSSGKSAPAIVANATATPSKLHANDAVPQPVSALAATLKTPAKIFTWVHDNVLWESYSGVAKGSAGTLAERRGNDWDQAVLLRDMLASQGLQAQLEWGRVTLPLSKAMNLAGTEDPMQAANLFATGGLDGVVLLNGSTPVAVQMTHAWVRAFIPFVPNRGATAGTPDTWVRMDPSFKRFDYQPGIAINGRVGWNEDEYLSSGVVRAPEDFYSDKIWAYIRANNLNCQNLAQVAKTGTVHAEAYPFVPSTLTARIDDTPQTSDTTPASQTQSIAVTVTDANGATVASWSTPTAAVWGKKVSVTFPPASADDAAIIASYGGIYNTPAYLIQLKPVFAVDDVPVATGAPVAAGAALDMNVVFHQPNVADDFAHHDVVAGETHALVLDPGAAPDSLVATRIDRFKTLAAGSDASATEKLYLVGLRYMQHADEGLAFATGVRWQRAVKRVFEADVRQQVNVTYNVAGAPLRIAPAEENIDVSRLAVGIVPINNDLSNRAETLALAGLQSSYLEGAIWEEMQSQQGISAAKALLLARRAGQTLYTVDAGNVDTVLATVNLSADVEDEIRGAVAQGRIAKIPTSNIGLNRWSGTGYILRDPQTGAATYPISGGLAGGSTTAAATALINDVFGSEPWLEDTPYAELLREWLIMIADMIPAGASTMQGDPINLSTGNMYRTFSDIAVPARGIPVGVSRTYNSRSSFNAEFGYGWTWSYGLRLTESTAGVTYTESDGTEHLFTANADGTYTAPAGKVMTLSRDVSGYTLAYPDGLSARFDSRGLLIQLRDSNNNTVTIARDASGLPVSVSDAAGRTVLTFTTAAGHVTAITDIAGRKVLFTYSGDDLTMVTGTDGKTWQYAYDLGHNLTQMVDPSGATNSFDYDTDDRMFHHVDATGAEEMFHYDIGDLQSVSTDRRGGDFFVQYDGSGRATVAVDPAGNRVLAEWDASNNRTAVTDSRGNTTHFEYDARGNNTREVRPDGAIVTRTYDTHSHLTAQTDELGSTTTYDYDAAGNLARSTRSVGGQQETRSFQYDSFGRLVATTDPGGNVSRIGWNDNGSMASITAIDGGITTMQSDALGRITKAIGASGMTVSFTYDDKDRIASYTDAYGVQTTIGYDPMGRRTSVTSPRGTSRFTYDAEGRQITASDALGNTFTTTYDAGGAVLSRRDPRGNAAHYEYDGAGRLVRYIDPNGAEWKYSYCAAVGSESCSSCGSSGGEQYCDIIDPTGGKLHREFDMSGRVVAVTDSLGHSIFTQYDKAGHVIVETDALGRATRYGYDEAGRVVTVADALNGMTTYGYDIAGNIVRRTDANGHAWNWKYDASRRVTEESDPLGRKTTYTYDAIGNVASRTDAGNRTTQYTYTGRRVSAITYADGSRDEFTYDTLGRRTQMRNANVTLAYAYDALDRLTSITNQTYNISVQYGYDADSNRIRMVTPRSTTTYTYDPMNRLARIDDSLFGAFQYGYDTMGRRTSLQYPNGTRTAYQYDAGSRATSVATTGPAGVFDMWAYRYDAVGNRIGRTDASGRSESFAYDDVNRLTDANYADGSSEKFTYDRTGNRLSLTTNTASVTYSYDVANQMLTAGSATFQYDSAGNLVTKTTPSGTTTMTYDGNNRIKTISGPEGTETNLYGPDGFRVDLAGTPIENGRVRVLNDADANPVLDWGTDNQTWTYRLYTPGGVDDLLAEYRRVNNRITYMHHDAVDSITAVSDSSGRLLYSASFKAFGEMSRTSDGSGIPPTRMGYTGRELSVGSMMHYRARHYDTSTGRFLQNDPIRATPSSLYSYAENNPMSLTDPMGLYCKNPSNGQINNQLGPNLTRGDPPTVPQTVLWTHPGFCYYMGATALNFYWDPSGNKYSIPWWGEGYLFPGHYNLKLLPYNVGSGPFNKGGYAFKSDIFNVHIGTWANAQVICWIMDDNKNYLPIHIAFCADWRILGATALAIVLIAGAWFILGLLGTGAEGALTAAPALAPVLPWVPKVIETVEEFTEKIAA